MDGQEVTRPWHFDGRKATRRHPAVVPDADGFRLVDGDWQSGPHRWGDLQPVESGAGRHVFGLKGIGGWRLGFDGDVPPGIAAHLPRAGRYGGWIDRVGLVRASIAFAIVAVIILYIGGSAPSWIAPHIPVAWENRLGDAMVGDFGGRFCRTPAGSAALSKLVGRMDGDGAARAVEVANIPLVNAIALPGGRIILFDGLIDQAKSPDEIAGIIGHELGHVRNRDTMTALVRQLGLSFLLGGIGGDTAGYVNTALALSYGRDAEGAADAHAIASLNAANISPADTADFFGRSSGKGAEGVEDAMTWFSSHPASGRRRAAFAAGIEKNRPYAPALTAREWAALRAICPDAPEAGAGE